MSKADIMFKKLGYTEATNNYNVQEKCTIYKNKNGECIYFSLVDKEVGSYREEQLYKCGKFNLISMQELQAINEKVKELRLVR